EPAAALPAAALPVGGPQPVGGQVEGGVRALQQLAPELDALAEPGGAGAGLLPAGVVGVLHGQFGQGERLVLPHRTAHGGELAEQDLHGRAVGGDVVDDDGEHVVLVVEPDQHRADGDLRGEVEVVRGPAVDDRAG